MTPRLAAVLLFAVELGGGFGTAAATVVSTTPQSMIVELHVVVEVDAVSVVAHFALPDEEQVTIPLLAREDGTYGVRTELKPANYQVVFEAVGDDPALSDPVSLIDLGADIGETADPAGDDDDDGLSPATQSWLWLGVALGAASLSALAFWVLGGREKGDADEDREEGEPAPVENVTDPP
jgi:hypothetical protein